jgi:hypothetical protein
MAHNPETARDMWKSDEEGMISVKLAKELAGEWRFNVDTGELTFLNELPNNDENFLRLHFFNSDGIRQRESTYRVRQNDLYLNFNIDDDTRNPQWTLSSVNYWEGIPEGYNANRPSNYPYEYTLKDLKLRREIILNAKFHGFGAAIMQAENAGVADPITAHNFWRLYGDELGKMILMRTYILESVALSSVAVGGGSGTARYGIRNRFVNFKNAKVTGKSTNFDTDLVDAELFITKRQYVEGVNKIDLMGGKATQLGKDYVNIDIVATKGIKGDVRKLNMFIRPNSVDEIVVSNPYDVAKTTDDAFAFYLNNAAATLRQGGSITVSGQLKPNRYVNSILKPSNSARLKQLGLEVEYNGPLIDKLKSLNFKQASGETIEHHTMTTIILRKK